MSNETKNKAISSEELQNIQRLCSKYGIHDYEINHNLGTINAFQDVVIEDPEIKYSPIKFDKVYGNFSYEKCYKLNSLKNSPRYIQKSFYCGRSPLLNSLENGPEEVYGDYICSECSLLSLKGSPKNMSPKSEFRCSANFLVNLIGAPTSLISRFEAAGNMLTSDEGCPTVSELLNLGWNQLCTLTADISKVKDLRINSNHFVSLKSINGLTKTDTILLSVQNNKISSFEGSPNKCTYMNVESNNISSMNGCPKICVAGINLSNNHIETFTEFPEITPVNQPQIILSNNPIMDLGCLKEYKFSSSIYEYDKMKVEIESRLKRKHIQDNLK